MALTRSKVEAGFEEKYHNFTYFLDDGDKEFSMLRDLCMGAVKDEQLLSNIKFCNDKFEIPPVRSFCVNYEDEIKEILEKLGKETLTPKQKRGLGAFWGAVFKCCLGYEKSDNKPVPLKDLGVSTASYFYPNPDNKNSKGE